MTTKNRGALIFVIVLLALTSVVWFVGPTARKHTSVVIAGATIDATVAETVQEQERGLSGVAALDDAHGMYFPFHPARSQAFWNKGMLMSFDLVWISGGRVIGIEQNFSKEADGIHIASSPAPITAVLELAHGWASRHQLHVGATVTPQN